METLDGTGVGNDLPVVVIMVLYPWHDHSSSATTSAAAYGPGCGRGQCGCQCQRRKSDRADSKEILERPRERTSGLSTMIEFIDQVLEGDRYARTRSPLRQRCRRQDVGVQMCRYDPRHIVGKPCRGLLLRHEAHPLRPVPVDPVDQGGGVASTNGIVPPNRECKK